MEMLTRIEEFALVAIIHLDDEAYGIKILEYLKKTTGRKWSIGALYSLLDRLEIKGFLETSLGEPTPRRGGRSKKYCMVTPEGMQELKRIRTLQDKIWAELPGEIG